MDRALILGDAIKYLKELIQRINDLRNKLESTSSSSSLPSASSFHPMISTPDTLPCRVKEELCPSLLPSPSNQPARGKYVTSRNTRDRLYCELERNLVMKVEDGETAVIFIVSGRGTLHITILIKSM